MVKFPWFAVILLVITRCGALEDLRRLFQRIGKNAETEEKKELKERES